MARSALIVDDHPRFRAWARQFLQAAGYLVMGEAAGGKEAIAAADRLRPDLVLLDIHLPDMEGFEVARWLALGDRGGPDVVLTSSREPIDFGRRIAESAALGFIAKEDLSAATLDAVLSGGG